MIIVLIHWKIKPAQEMVDKFLDFWRKCAVIDDRRGLIGEFLTEVHSTAEYSWITWQLAEGEGTCRHFINVGFWNSAEEFREQVGKYFALSTGKKEFEAELRKRTALKPKCWRIGDGTLPIHDSGGVL